MRLSVILIKVLSNTLVRFDRGGGYLQHLTIRNKSIFQNRSLIHYIGISDRFFMFSVVSFA